MPYPTNDEIKAIVGTMFTGGHASPDGFDSIISESFEGAVAGRHFTLGAANLEGKKAWIDQLVQPLRNAHDLSKPANMSVIRVIGGGNDGWCAIETLGTGTSKAGKKWHNETVVLARFSEDKKLVEAKVFMDQQHVQKHIDEAGTVKA